MQQDHLAIVLDKLPSTTIGIVCRWESFEQHIIVQDWAISDVLAPAESSQALKRRSSLLAAPERKNRAKAQHKCFN